MNKVLLMAVILLTGCDTQPPEYIETCLKYHTETKPMFFPNGKGSMTMIMMPRAVCTLWEKKRNPEYDAQK